LSKIFTVHNCRTSVQSRATLTNTHGCTGILKTQKPPQNSRCQKGDMQQVPFWWSTNSRRHHTKLSSYGDITQNPYIHTHTSHICASAWRYHWIQHTI